MNADSAPLIAAPPKKRRLSRGWWLRQLHTWHWISAAVSLIGMLMFAITGVTLNHADIIPATPAVTAKSGMLAPSLLRLLKPAPKASDAPVPAQVADAVSAAVGLNPAGRPAEWSDAEVYVAMPRPGGDAWVSVDRASGAIKSEVTSQGLLSLLNDLHKGRNTGIVWRLFIDLFAAAAILFTATGLLLLQFHAKHRKKTWPLVGLGFAVPLVIALIFIH
ncbi:PepSY-associated TM helix domain-containing protein [Sphingomonas immobilis]|uniref:PepSY-associated TM helix domain-containing protein n=1 Tax=Sphingomonas immobilis TaxID=3063997 RepID=A0ABT9A457_9SPHN|nr:PepSY-associated TM helix domain-containing protein [Sphingomonas sp. CA1-15]MDO7844129.1 PepSY-associated TM helix domain-containing protein [Sphingomonas sp. CA1-15]